MIAQAKSVARDSLREAMHVLIKGKRNAAERVCSFRTGPVYEFMIYKNSWIPGSFPAFAGITRNDDLILLRSSVPGH